MEDHRRPQDREQLEQKLRKQLTATEQTYRSAQAQTQIILDQYGDLPLGHSDGNLARRKAAFNEAMALEKYQQSLKAFADVVVHGRRLPTENETSAPDDC